MEINIRPVEGEDANTTGEIYRVLSDSTATEPELNHDFSDEGGPAMPLYYLRRGNQGEIE